MGLEAGVVGGEGSQVVACFVIAREAQAVFNVVGELHGSVESGALVAVLCGCPSDSWGEAKLLGQGASQVGAQEEMVCPGVGAALGLGS